MRRLGTLLTRVAHGIGRVQAWLILTLFYFLIMAPVACIFQRCADPLRLRRKAEPAWKSRSEPPDRWAWAKAQS